MARSSSKETRSRKWLEVELKVFASVLADDQDDFALTLETLALKKSVNFHIFQNIKTQLNARLQTENIPCSTKKGKDISCQAASKI